MKKLVVILVFGLILASVVSAQTYSDVKSENSQELKALNDKLAKINDRIYYLDVTLPIDSATTNGAMHRNNAKKRDLLFRTEESKRLKSQKTLLLTAIDKLDKSSYKIDDERMAEGSLDNLPERMGPVEYKQRGRSESIKLARGGQSNTTEQRLFNGLLINSKIGMGEKAYFKFRRIDIKENFERAKIPVDPKDEVEITLPMGIYVCTVECGNLSYAYRVPVDPRSTTKAGKDKKTVYFWMEKTLSDF